MTHTPQSPIITTDTNGVFQNPYSWETINYDSQKILQKVSDLITETLGESVDSIYVRGSFASNSRVSGYSDIDIIVIVKGGVDKSLFPSVITHDDQTFRLDLELFDYNHFLNPNKSFGTKFLLKTQSVCIWGDNKLDQLSEFEASTQTSCQFGRNIPQLINKTKIVLESHPEKLAPMTQWICRALIRATNGLFLDREQVYTRDLVLCYRYFIKYYPMYESQMRLLVEQAIEPTLTIDELMEILDDFGAKLSELVEERCENN